MNIEKIDKWLDNEYGVSYTRLEELHDFVVEQDLKHREEKDKEIERLNNIIDGLEEYIKPYLYMLNGIQDRDIYEQCQLDDFTDIMEKLQELKENK